MSAREPASVEAPSIEYIIAKVRKTRVKAAMTNVIPRKLSANVIQDPSRRTKLEDTTFSISCDTYSKS